MFNPTGNKIIPEYFMELMAQSMAAVNGFDSISDGKDRGTGFLVGIDDFKWYGPSLSSGNFRIEIVKDFEFGQVTVMSGKIFDDSGELVASGEIKAWEA
jgi:predicted hotdog family 3-hydroxylacyl-ACP dehydratase